MKRLLLVLCWLVAAREAGARRPAVRFDLPCTVEHGKYVVVLGTPAGPRRFIFDTGATSTCISESLRSELGAETVKTLKTRDFEGHVIPIDLVRLDSLRMGDALFRNHPVLVMPDSSYVFRCMGLDGIAGCDLLRGFVVRLPNADSTITVTDDVRTMGVSRRRMSRMMLGGGCPFLPVTCRNGDKQAGMYVKFDTGSAGYFHFSYAGDGATLSPLGFVDNLRWADGYASSIGWTNCNRVNSHFRGTIPRFEIQGTTIADMPVKRTFGRNRILGCKLLDWGQVVLDFPRKRFLFIPREGVEAKAEPQPAYNFTLTVSAGRLIVGQVWDETLVGIITPGDRILSLDGTPWDGDICGFLLDPNPMDGIVCGIGTADGQHVVLTIENMK